MQQTLGGGIEELLELELPLLANPSSVMGLECVVVDVSSDDEDPGPWRSRGRDWVDELLERSVRPRVEDSDDVVVVDAFAAPVSKRRSENRESMGVEKRNGLEDDDDDVCLVLDSDPDKPVSVVADYVDRGRDGDEDMLIVAEKGQVACRDYPHSRHLCATYSFISSPHEEHCNLCHCYVCDSPAPCSFWGNGKLSTDHCHSNDKETNWNRLRELFRKRKKVATQPQKFTDSMSVHHSNTVPSRSMSLQPCITTFSNSDATNQIIQCQPSIISRRIQRAGQQPIRSHPLYPRVQPAQKEIRLAALTTQLMNSHTRSRRTGSTQVGLRSSSSHRTVSNHNHIPRAVQQKSTCLSSQIPHCPQGQLVDQMQTTLSSPSTQSPRQSSLFPLGTAQDICEKSWQDILASLQSELDADTGIPNYQQPVIIPSPSLPYEIPFSETCANPDRNFASHTVAQIPEHDQGEGPPQSTAQMSNTVFPVSNTVSGENCLDSLLPSVDNELWSEIL